MTQAHYLSQMTPNDANVFADPLPANITIHGIISRWNDTQVRLFSPVDYYYYYYRLSGFCVNMREQTTAVQSKSA
jgi:hypothetical protein